jgi:N-acetylmuramoyl-L-alanine amidase-like protein
MARYPDASWRPLAGGHQAVMPKHDVVCLHTMVGYLTTTDAMFKRNGWTGTESHFGVGGKWGGDADKGYDGKVFQWGDTAYKADANLDGWDRVISIETADNAPGLVKNIQPWTPKQLDAIVKLVAWLCRKHDIPPVLIPDSKPSRRGIGYHQLGCEHSRGVGAVPGFLVKGGERWSKSEGKECPGPQRIAQVKTIIVPRVKALLAPKPTTPKPKPPVKETPAVAAITIKDVLDMKFTLTTQYQADQMKSNGGDWKVGDSFTLRDLALWGGPGTQRILHTIRDSAADIDAVTALLKAIDLQVPDDLGTRLTGLETGIGKIPNDLATRLQVLQDSVDKLTPATPTGDPRSV